MLLLFPGCEIPEGCVIVPTAEYLALPEIEKLAGEYSDMFKSVNGFRPRWTNDWTVEEYKAELESLYAENARQMDDERIEQAAAAVEFEAAIVKVMAMGAADRETAMRWMRDGSYYGNEELEYENGLAYGSLGGTRALRGESVWQPTTPDEFDERQAAFLASLHRSFV